MAVVELESLDKVALIKLNNGSNTQNPEFTDALTAVLKKVQNDSSFGATVITSTDTRHWSQGLDLAWVISQMESGSITELLDFFRAQDKLYSQLMLLPIPVIAAINGHVAGAGVFLAAACDFRFMNAQKGFLCLPEIDLKFDFSPGVFRMLTHKFPDFLLSDLILTGRRAGGVEMERYHFISRTACSSEETLQQALEFARGFNKDRDTFERFKIALNGIVAEELISLDEEYFQRNANLTT